MQHDPWRTFKSVALPFNLSDLDFKTDTAENADIISVHSEAKRKGGKCKQLLVFSVTPFKIDQNKNQTVRIKSRIWEMKGGECANTLAKI